ncbi:hypothetical protein SUGI_1515880 [Cryptomeria japonica]|uniref:DM13 domain-containing protein n=1 Tax=Cryptomeria japonica TaxID=3369 RepID=A0AAD3NTI2_CRYJA|nr:hypothetical protein SUGI_1515880 [Cryptomeria japonica]
MAGKQCEPTTATATTAALITEPVKPRSRTSKRLGESGSVGNDRSVVDRRDSAIQSFDNNNGWLRFMNLEVDSPVRLSLSTNTIIVRAVACLQLLAERALLSSVWAAAQASQTGPAASTSGNGNGNYRQHHYFGTLIGKLNKRDHNVSGEVFAVDEQTLFIKNFNYDGLAPDAYFWSSVSASQPAALEGFIVPDEKGSTKPLERYADKDVVLRLPEGRTLREINWLSVWSRQTKQNLGEILIPRQQLVIPRPLEIGGFSQLAHGLKSGPITIVDAQTFLVPDFHYDGLGPAAYFWLTRGSQGLQATGLRLKDENGSGQALKKYVGETVVITLPEELTIYDFDWFGVWCKEFQVNFGQTRIPQLAKVPRRPRCLE